MLGDRCADDADAQALLERALLCETEPLVYFSVQLNIAEAKIFERAAQWTGMAFSAALPREIPANPTITRTDALAHVRSLRARLFDRDVLFTAAGLTELLRIKEQIKLQPDLARKICLVPPRALRSGLADRSAKLLLAESRTRLSRRWAFASAHLDLTLVARIVFIAALGLLVALAALTPFVLRPILVPILGFLLLAPAALRLVATLSSYRPKHRPIIPPVPIEELPVYTILIPLRDEANMVPQLVWAMRRLDYPPEKLDIKFVVESQSEPTLRAVAAALEDSRFELVIVPQADPATKPKALNYALPLARGEFLVIYDAEDIPQPNQLKHAVALFAAEPSYDCIQAELTVDNGEENWLTALFAGEYSGLFGLMLPALARWRFPLPLGGTSNHFRLQSLKEAGGWDAFNVTEDADLGVRLSRLRYRTSTFESKTFEEAPVTIKMWMHQRTRWMKGWMQTFIVHNRHPVQFFKDIGWRNFFVFQAYVGGMILSAPLHTVFLVVFLVRFFGGSELGFAPTDIWGVLQMTILFVGYGSAFWVSTQGLARLGLKHLIPFQFLLPVYWVLNSVAAMIAIVQLIRRPYFWAKTPHGVTRFARGGNVR